MLQIKRIFSRFLILFFLSFTLNAQIFLRTSIDKEKIGTNDKIFVAVDFKVPIGEHITSPVGKGKPLAPGVKWENAEVLEVFWPTSVELPNAGGGKSEYFGYDKDFTLLYSLKINDVSKPVKYNLFYVVCGSACKPVQHSGELSLNGLLLHDEIDKVTGKEVNTGGYSFILMILFGLLGGAVLNCMPCVFPIISMKIFGIIKSSEDTESSVKKHGIAFSIGVISTFLALGSLLLVLRQSMPSIGWGFYMQDPRFVVCLLTVFLLCSLNFFGLYNLSFPGIKSMRLPVKNIYIKSFFSGVFGAFVSAACVGPFAGVAIASALLYGSVFQSLCIFIALGVGVAFPFLLLSFFPRLVKFFPKPGEWMERFKEFVGFAMLLSCVWLLWVLSSQINISKLIGILFILVIISIFVWMFGKAKESKKILITAVLGVIASCYFAINFAQDDENQPGIKWTDYTTQIFDDANKKKKSIFLNFTASWCLNCQFNNLVFSNKEVIEAFEKNGILALKCDWTNRNEEISNLLSKFGVSSVPYNVIYKSGKKPLVLPTLLTKQIILDALNSEGEG